LLSPEQIEVVNILVADHWERRMAEGAQIRSFEPPLQPDQTASASNSAHSQPTASQSMTKLCGNSSGLMQPGSVHSDRPSSRPTEWRMMVPWQ
jgi:hypothetical protein